jgi:hypothetical protein
VLASLTKFRVFSPTSARRGSRPAPSMPGASREIVRGEPSAVRNQEIRRQCPPTGPSYGCDTSGSGPAAHPGPPNGTRSTTIANTSLTDSIRLTYDAPATATP